MALHNCYLPLWLHRVCNGALGTVASATLASVGLSYFPSDHLLYQLSSILLYLSVPIGIFLAAVAPRFSIVQGLAGDAGYDELIEDDNGRDNP